MDFIINDKETETKNKEKKENKERNEEKETMNIVCNKKEINVNKQKLFNILIKFYEFEIIKNNISKLPDMKTLYSLSNEEITKELKRFNLLDEMFLEQLR